MTRSGLPFRAPGNLRRSRIKRLIAALLGLGLIAATMGLLVLSGQITLQSSTGATVSSGLHEVATVPVNASQLVTWLPDAWQRERVLEPATRMMIAASYIRAWAAIGHFQSTGERPAVNDTFSGSARRAVLELPRTGPSATWDLRHSLELEFYALDGATVAFHDGGANIARTVGTGLNETVLLGHESYDVVMVLEDGFWRIHQLRRSAGSDTVTLTTDAAGATVITGAPTTTPLTIPESLATEYRPAGWAPVVPVVAKATATPTPTPGATPTAAPAVTPVPAPTVLAPATLGADFARLRALGFDTIRVPLPYTQLGGAKPTDDAITGLITLLEQADRHGLRVELVLFDGFPDLTPANWLAADAHLTAIATAVRGQPALALWDLADRPEQRSTGSPSPAEIRAFLLHTGATLRELDPGTPQTISWATSTAASDPSMAGLVDAVSLHLTGGGDPAAAIEAVRTALPDRAMLLTVTGLSTEGGWGPLPKTEARQASDVARVLLGAERAGLSHLSVATFADTKTDAGGLLRADGSAKPAAALFESGAQLTTIPVPGLLDYATSKFWILVFAVLLAGAGALLLARRRRRKRALPAVDSAHSPTAGQHDRPGSTPQ
ncbi:MULTISPECIES: hypothetical protein [unclassified Cryobacterium]|uniref:hypothetical protein n=1 Tax=unclassified Cryobacterium TaxID=2649013 RepID=UPI002AB529C8|nr:MULTISPECIES: hypothetical protein [unclassified Cryobacterium]MDY7541911.1 hypothetical protein [Cryobacterium sp. 5B3]MEA9998599.1 hypothetical protein [Cryobacterium sp. RTS3]MEB0266866.1 hypothetical protein [Cryobacterium sp. 10I5]MEB0276079.1 hypothetical protein [Cryobacterium sp. 5B3]